MYYILYIIIVTPEKILFLPLENRFHRKTQSFHLRGGNEKYWEFWVFENPMSRLGTRREHVNYYLLNH